MKYKDLKLFFEQKIWTLRPSQVNPWLWRFYCVIKVILLSIKQSGRDKLFIRASALTYNTALSSIPFLAILFAIARGFGVEKMLEDRFRAEISSQEADIILNWVNSYLLHAQSGIFVGAGFLVLIWALFMLISSIESNFNDMWQVQSARSIYRKITDYFSMFLLLPLLLVIYSGVTILMTSYMRDILGFELLAPLLQFGLKLVPTLLICAIFLGIYVFIPNTTVKVRYAILPAIVAGLSFQLFQYFYINTQIWFSSYNAIYGSFAAIPLFLLFTQISWTICLFGVVLCFSSQNLSYYNYKTETDHISRQEYDFCCALVLSDICKRFSEGKPAPSAESLSLAHGMPIRLTNNILRKLMEIELISPIATNDKQEAQSFLPAMDIHLVTLGLLLQRLDESGTSSIGIEKGHGISLKKHLRDARKLSIEHAEHVLLKDFQ